MCLKRFTNDIYIEYLLQANELLQFGEEEPDTVEQVIPYFSNFCSNLATLLPSNDY